MKNFNNVHEAAVAYGTQHSHTALPNGTAGTKRPLSYLIFLLEIFPSAVEFDHEVRRTIQLCNFKQGVKGVGFQSFTIAVSAENFVLMASQGQHIVSGLCLVLVIFCIVSLAVNDWSKISGGTTVGLWKVCGGGTCASFTCTTDECTQTVNACRAFSLLALFFAIAALACCLAAFYGGKGGANAILILLIISGACSLIAFAVWVGKSKKVANPDGYGAGVAFAIIDWLLAWIIAGLAHKQGTASASG